MRPHTHTHDVRHTRLPLSPRTSKPKSKLRVKRVCPACCAECVTAPARGRPGVRSGRRTRHTTRTATDPSQTATQTQPRRRSHADADTQSRHADADTQTRASNEARNDGPLRQRARELRHRVLGDVHAVVLPAPSARSAAAAAATDLLRRRFQGRSSWIQFVSVQASSGGLCSRSAHRTKRVWSRTNTWRHVALPAAGRPRVSSSSVSARRSS